MIPALDNRLEQLRDLIRAANGENIPNWIELPSQGIDEMSIRAGIAKLLGWLRGMAMSKRVRELQLTDQAWALVVKAIANTTGTFLALRADEKAISVNDKLSHDEIMTLCTVASNEFRPRIMPNPVRDRRSTSN